MRLLLVDDDGDKRTRVRAILEDRLADDDLQIDEAIDYETTLAALRDVHYDLVVLDLLLPGAGNPPSRQTSREIIHRVTDGIGLVPPAHIIGLTAYEEVAQEERQFYDERLLDLECYSPLDSLWADRLVAKIRYLERSRLAGLAFQSRRFDLDVVILAARYANEFVPARSALFLQPYATEHTLWRGDIALGNLLLPGMRSLDAAICCIGEMGMASAAAVASQAISIFRPRLLAMVGMCCGFATERCAYPRKLMDAIVVREANCWEEGKYVELSGSSSEFKNRSKTRLVDDSIRGNVEQVIEREIETLEPSLRHFAKSARFRKIRDHYPEGHVGALPDVKFAPLVSGSSVIADEAMIDEILDRNPAAVGLDMETVGVYSAAEKSLGRRPSVLAVKGVADFGQREKDDTAQQAATVVATTVLKGILPHLQIW